MTLTNESRLRASALRLSFGELWQSMANDLETHSSRPRVLRFEYFAELAEDITLRVMGFLDAKSLTRVCSSCKTLYIFAQRPVHHKTLWEPHFETLRQHLYLTESECAFHPTCLMKRKYLKVLLLRHEAELRHMKTLRSLLSALCQMPKGSVVNVVSNIGSFDNAAVAVAVSATRQVAMSTIILSRTEDAILFRKVTEYVGPVSFYSQDNISPLLTANPSLEMPRIEADGFIGYAVNLLRLDPKEEYMRYTFLLCAFKNLTVWETSESERAAREAGVLPSNVLSVSIDAFTDVSCWFRTGMLGARFCPCFVSFGSPRRKFGHQEDVTLHLNRLESTRDRLREALAHFD